MSFFTRPNFEDRQIVQYSGTSITLSGTTIVDSSGSLRITKDASQGLIAISDAYGNISWGPTSGITLNDNFSLYWTSGSSGSYSVRPKNNSDVDSTGDYSLSTNYSTLATGDYSHAEGYFTTTGSYTGLTAYNYFGLKYNPIVVGSTGELYIIGDVTFLNSNARILFRAGTSYYRLIVSGVTSGSGYSIVTTSNEPIGTTIPFATSTTVRAFQTSSEGQHAEGFVTIASGDYSHAEGYNTIASGDYSHAEGFGIANGDYSHAEGSGTANGDYSHAEGVQTQARGSGSHATGFRTITYGDYSYTGGAWSIASGESQTVVGYWNKPISTYGAFIIGNGAGLTNESNLLVAAGDLVEISGKTKTTNFQMTSGASSGYHLTSDSVGNGIWKRPMLYGSFYDSGVTQTTTAGTIKYVAFNQTDISDGITRVADSGFTVSVSGIYNVQFSLQLYGAGGADTVYIWPRVNNLNVPNSNGKITLGNNTYVIAAWNLFLSLSAGDSVSLMWVSNGGGSHIEYDGTPPYGPDIPPAIITINQIQ